MTQLEQFQPTRNRVLVEKLDVKEQVTDLGLVITLNPPKNEAVIKAVGPGATYWDSTNSKMVTIPVDFKVDQKVWVPEHGMTPCTLDGTEYWLITDDQILGVLNDS